MDNLLAWGGSAAVIAFIVGAWRHIMTIWQQISSCLIIRVTLVESAANAMLAYCNTEMKRSPFGPLTYIAWRDYVRPRRRYERIVAESLGGGGRFYWRGWRPIWMTRTSGNGNDSNDQLYMIYRPVSLTFLRWTFDADQLVEEAVAYFNQNIQDEGHSRFRVNYLSGTVGQVPRFDDSGAGAVATSDVAAEPANENGGVEMLITRRLIGWTPDDIGPETHKTGNAIGDVALSPEMASLWARLKRWRQSRQWFSERGLPWKYGTLLYGPAGNGKTAFVRAAAEDLNMPVYVFDLTTMLNDELRRCWNKMRSNAPCIALMEDIDNVFHGRDPADDDIKLGFEALLNCLDGVERADGVLLFVTTNCIEHLDPALGGPVEDGQLASRPGRIDCSIPVHAPDADGRRQIAYRILKDWPDMVEPTVQKGDNDTGAQFERRCIDLAEDLYWNGRNGEATSHFPHRFAEQVGRLHQAST